MFEFIFPQRDLRLQALTAFFHPFVADGLARGEVWLAPAEQGVCIWYPASVPLFDDAFEAAVEEAIATASRYDGAADRFEHLVNQVSAYEPTVPRYEVLWIALVPEARGRGLGGHLLQPALDAADGQGAASYLVSSNHRNLSFYQRHGFQPTAAIAISPTYAMTGMGRKLDPSP
jgi:GNAT superfamily N-acetyltransferase